MKINIGRRDKSGTQDLDYYYENYPPRKSAVFYKKKVREHKWVGQLLVSGVIFLVVLGLFKLNIPFTAFLKNGVKYFLTSEINIRPVFSRLIQFASQAGDLEWPLSDDVSPPSKTVITEVPSGIVLLLPVSGNIIRTYGWLTDSEDQVQKFHQGIDIAVPVGTEVRASAGGKVVNIGENSSLGRYILVKNNTGELVRYANLSEVLVRVEQAVKTGDIIAKTGMPADRQPHLHFEVIINGRPVDPLAKLGVDFSRLNGTNTSDLR